MPDATLVFPPGYRATDATGTVVSGGKLKFYNAGTLVARTVYSNLGLSSSLGSTVFTGSDGMPVASSGSSTEVSVYTGTTPYKIVFTTSADVEIWTLDNLIGALDTSTFLTTGSTSTLSIPVISKTGNYTITTTDRGKLVQGNAGGGNFTLTLDAAATLGDGWNVEIRNSGTSGQVILAASQAIAFEGQTFTSRALELGEAFAIRCDGTAFKIVGYTPPLMSSRSPGVICVTDRITSDPVSPTPGARYIVQTGYGSYATHDIIEANGSSFNKYTPVADCGWIAYVKDEDIYYLFRGSAWVAETATSTQQGTVKVSTQAIMETGTATDTAVLVGHQHFHPGHPKFWGYVTVAAGTPTLQTSHNVTSITDTNTGILDVTIATDYSSANWCTLATADQSNQGGEGGGVGIFCSSKAAGTVTLVAEDGDEDAGNGDRADPTAWNFAGFGDQA